MSEICGAKLRNKDGVCGSKSLFPNNRCRLHGGKSPVGIASPQFKTGRHSKYLPVGIAEKYSLAKEDENLVALSDEIALVDSYLNERLEKLYSGESERMWLRLKSHYNSYVQALEEAQKPPKKDKEGNIIKGIDPNEILVSMGETIQRGLVEFSIYEQVQPMIEQRRRLVESEAKRMKELEQNITADKAMGIIALLADIVRRNVTDRNQLAAISNELAAAVNK